MATSANKDQLIKQPVQVANGAQEGALQVANAGVNPNAQQGILAALPENAGVNPNAQPQDFATFFSGLAKNYESKGLGPNTQHIFHEQISDVDRLLGNQASLKALENLYKVDPTAKQFTDPGAARAALSRLSNQASRVGDDKAARQFYRSLQGTEAAVGESYGPTRDVYNTYQQLIRDATPVAADQDWYGKTGQFGARYENQGTIWRDPTSKGGVGVFYNEEGVPSGLKYFDSAGNSLGNSIISPGELIKNAEKYGIDLSNISGLESELN